MNRLEDYEPVEARLEKFWARFPEGRIITDLIAYSEQQFIVRTEAYTDRDDARPAAVGYAEEKVGSSPVNRTSALENCETSSIGRCLANLGFATKGKRPSREEMSKAAPVATGGNYCTPKQRDFLKALLAEAMPNTTSDQRAAQIAVLVGREVTSLHELTSLEASKLIEHGKSSLARLTSSEALV